MTDVRTVSSNRSPYKLRGSAQIMLNRTDNCTGLCPVQSISPIRAGATPCTRALAAAPPPMTIAAAASAAVTAHNRQPLGVTTVPPSRRAVAPDESNVTIRTNPEPVRSYAPMTGTCNTRDPSGRT